MKVGEIAEAIAKLAPDQLARFRWWFTAFEAGENDEAFVTKASFVTNAAYFQRKTFLHNLYTSALILIRGPT